MKKRLDIDVNLTGAKNATTQIKGFGDRIKSTQTNLLSMANIVRGVFASSLIYGAAQLVKAGAAAEGVERAFNRLNKPGLLSELQRSTRGAVSNLDLMKAAVRAENFQIPLEQLGTLLEFAQRRAEETGESVDYLTESIVMGIGRKSVMILDNLGLSALRVRDEFKKTGDMAQAVAKIAAEEMEKIGTAGSTTATSIAKISTQFENLKISAGSWIIENLAVQKGLENLNAYFNGYVDDAEMWATVKSKLVEKGFIDQGKAVDSTKAKFEAAEKLYIEWVMGIEDEAAQTKQAAEWRARYNKEIAMSMGLWNTNPQATADPLMGAGNQGNAMTADIISEDNLKRSAARVRRLEDEFADIGKSIEIRNQELAYQLTNEITRAWQVSFAEGKFEAGKFFDYLKTRIIEELIYTVISEIIKSVISAYSGGDSSWYSAIVGATGGEGALTGDVSVGSTTTQSVPTIGGAGGSAPKSVVNNITFQGVSDKEYIRTTVLPEIQKATRLGLQ